MWEPHSKKWWIVNINMSCHADITIHCHLPASGTPSARCWWGTRSPTRRRSPSLRWTLGSCSGELCKAASRHLWARIRGQVEMLCRHQVGLLCCRFWIISPRKIELSKATSPSYVSLNCWMIFNDFYFYHFWFTKIQAEIGGKKSSLQ